jgi:hypothetical protein
MHKNKKEEPEMIMMKETIHVAVEKDTFHTQPFIHT